MDALQIQQFTFTKEHFDDELHRANEVDVKQLQPEDIHRYWTEEIGKFNASNNVAVQVSSRDPAWTPEPYLIERMERSIRKLAILNVYTSLVLENRYRSYCGRSPEDFMPKVGTALDVIIGLATIGTIFAGVMMLLFNLKSSGSGNVTGGVNGTTVDPRNNGTDEAEGKLVMMVINIATSRIRDWMWRESEKHMKEVTMLKDIVGDDEGARKLDECVKQVRAWKNRARAGALALSRKAVPSRVFDPFSVLRVRSISGAREEVVKVLDEPKRCRDALRSHISAAELSLIDRRLKGLRERLYDAIEEGADKFKRGEINFSLEITTLDEGMKDIQQHLDRLGEVPPYTYKFSSSAKQTRMWVQIALEVSTLILMCVDVYKEYIGEDTDLVKWLMFGTFLLIFTLSRMSDCYFSAEARLSQEEKDVIRLKGVSRYLPGFENARVFFMRCMLWAEERDPIQRRGKFLDCYQFIVHNRERVMPYGGLDYCSLQRCAVMQPQVERLKSDYEADEASVDRELERLFRYRERLVNRRRRLAAMGESKRVEREGSPQSLTAVVEEQTVDLEDVLRGRDPSKSPPSELEMVDMSASARSRRRREGAYVMSDTSEIDSDDLEYIPVLQSREEKKSIE